MSSANAASFVPIHSALEVGKDRTTLSIQLPSHAHANGTTLFLGRGGSTRISEPRMSRKIAKIQWTWIDAKPTLMIESVAGQGTVQVNAKVLQSEPVPLLQGDVVSLISPDMSNAYDYQVDMPACLKQSDSQSTHELQESSSNKRQSSSIDVSEEFSCSICLEIMVNPVSAVPCGHAFCGECLSANVRECPNCRAALHAKPVPSRPLGQAIALLVENQPDLFSSDDIAQYRSRKNAGIPLHPRSSARPVKRTKFVSLNSAGMSADSAIVID